MKIFKGYTNNHHRPEALIVERYITEEALEFYSNYLLETESIGILKSCHANRFEGRGTQGLNVKSMGRDVVLQTYFYILNNLSVVEPYMATHKEVIKKKYPRMNDKLLLTQHNKEFISWFDMRISNDYYASEIIKWLLYMPNFTLITWTTCKISNYSFYIKAKDDCSTMQNSKVMVETESVYFSS
ncbi:hypothetical protein KIW84_011414 [Lathyrus oleraceus]|uniref:DUF4218 domain-containing protein n=1 Tax=Pisum sativum TaxID=3888 RepID=A0A9D5BEV3_PEA|nr:hypothetical protein KIW84_011414 [Pisum sativum]